jgi:hypothetical protein
MPAALPWLLIAAPVLFNATYFTLAARFSYPGILREPTAVILRRFTAGGPGLVLLWWAFAMSALFFVPVAVLAGSLVADPSLAAVAVTVGVLAGVVQTLGLIRWVFLVPHLARESEAGADPKTIDLLFQSFHRYLGVAVGEHLGYLSTGAWTVLLSIGAWSSLPAWLTFAGRVLGAMQFLGPFENKGWKLAGLMVPVGYTAWALWLVALGVVLLVR